MGLALAGLLIAGCSQSDATTEATAASQPVPITFDCSTNYYTTTDTRAMSDGEVTTTDTRAVNGREGEITKTDLYLTGFGVFATQRADHKPDLMYNQQVTYTLVGDLQHPDPSNPYKGYWSYAPQKFWPSDVSHVAFCAYAPYVATPVADDGVTTGIVGMSGNDETTPYILYRRCLHPEENVDLLWAYSTPTLIPEATTGKAAGTLSMTMYHALSRLKLNIKLKAAAPADTKVLVERITLSGKTAKTGKLLLNHDDTEDGNHYPTWQVTETEDRTITIDNTTCNDENYGIIDTGIGYRSELPYRWQPTGLTTTFANALTTIDRITYIYLIPQDELTLNCQITYHIMTASTDVTKTTNLVAINIPDTPKPMRGNTTYCLNMVVDLNPTTP